MKAINRAALITAKIIEIVHWIMASAWLCILVIILTQGQSLFGQVTPLGKLFTTNVYAKGLDYAYSDINVYGLTVINTSEISDKFVSTGRELDKMEQEIHLFHIDAIIVYCIGCMLMFILVALILNSVFRIIRIASKKRSPFQKKIVNRIRMIGICFFGMSAVSTVTSLIAGIMTGSIHLCPGIEYIILGIFMLCLTVYFRHGIQLEEDAEGLI